jgi:riboflavin synthase
MIADHSGTSSMFTGIVEAIGVVESIQRVELEQAAVVRLVVGTDVDVASLPLGASIAVDGVCLTVVERAVGHFAADLGPETLALTTLGTLQPGDRVHLERPLRVGDPLGGHMVAGHVDATGTVVSRRASGAALEMEIEAPPTLSRFIAAKGSIAVDGVSLTVNVVTDHVFSVTLVPHTLAATKLGDKQAGDPVNLEADLIVKHIDRLLSAQFGGERGAASHTPRREISIDTLRRYGFVR